MHSGFEDYYKEEFGERWPSLREALMAPDVQIARANVFAKDLAFSKGREEKLKACFEAHGLEALGLSSEDLLPYYLMDPASVIAARALEVQAGEEILDLCAAPGGKTLILSEAMGPKGRLIANDRSSGRRSRLKKILTAYLPEKIRERIQISSHDATKWGLFEKNQYDRILLDAPCSSERHVLKDPQALKEWSPSRPKRLAIQQYAMLAAALDAAKPEGQIVYSTCALTSVENDQVIDKLIARRGNEFKILAAPYEKGERTKNGCQILPDTSEGWGPIYFSVLRKLNSRT